MWQWFSNASVQASLVGSFAGLISGVVILLVGALFNFRLNRRRDALVRAEEADAVAAALFGEIILIRKELARTANLVARKSMHGDGEFDSHFLELMRLQDPLLYKALASKLGLLDPKLILAITDFHTNVEMTRSSLPLIVENKDRGYSYSPLAVLTPATAAIQDIKPTIDALAAKMRVPLPEDLDISNALFLVDSEREIFTEPN
ncbi:hypothetical protein [Pararhizobium sp. PWRC1-1]|uniref:hypothetical protein n=1 Tax=Pararhizobium sp. PWRC1-1 TaxID=2804566 RepID=UPI003CFBA09C